MPSRERRKGRARLTTLLALSMAWSAGTLSCRSIRRVTPIADATVCDLVRNPAHYDGLWVRVRGCVHFALLDVSPFLDDNSCPGRISLDDRDQSLLVNDKQFEDYYNQMLRGMAGEFNASFEGRFQRDTKNILGLHLHWWPGTRLGMTLMIHRVLRVAPFKARLAGPMPRVLRVPPREQPPWTVLATRIANSERPSAWTIPTMCRPPNGSASPARSAIRL